MAAALKLAEYAKLANHPFEQLEYLTVATLAVNSIYTPMTPPETETLPHSILPCF